MRIVTRTALWRIYWEKGGAVCVTFSQLRDKDVINIPDGRKLGKPIDLTFCENAMIEAIVVPGPSSIWNCFSREREGCAIPWNRIRRIGDDVILVDLDANFWNQQ